MLKNKEIVQWSHADWSKQSTRLIFYTFCSGQSTPSLASPKLRLWYWHKNTFRKEPNIREVLWKKKCQREWSSFRNLHDFSRKRRRPLPACIHIYWKLWGLNENFRKTPKQSPLPSFSVTALLKIITVVFFSNYCQMFSFHSSDISQRPII